MQPCTIVEADAAIYRHCLTLGGFMLFALIVLGTLMVM